MCILQKLHKKTDGHLCFSRKARLRGSRGAPRKTPRLTPLAGHELIPAHSSTGELSPLRRGGIKAVDDDYNTCEESIWGVRAGISKGRTSGLSRWPPSGFESVVL